MMHNCIKRLLSSLLPQAISDNRRFQAFLANGYHSEMWGGGIFADNVETAIDKFAPQSRADEAILNKLRRDISLCYIHYGATPDEYFLLGLDSKSRTEREAMVTDMLKDKESLRTISIERFNSDLTDKYNFYCHNKAFFRREAIYVDSSTDRNELIGFLNRHRRVFAKPIDGSYGAGAHIIDIEHGQDAALLEFAEGRWIVEELIIQDSLMACWNQTSVNTVRVPSIMAAGKPTVIGPFLRTGRRGAVIDNAGGGGVLAALDAFDGRVISDGFSEQNIFYVSHPDSGIKFKGWQVPRWDELMHLSAEIHRNMPDHKYIAFDFALTPDGWVLIEGNWGQFLWQYAARQGLKKQFVSLMRS